MRLLPVARALGIAVLIGALVAVATAIFLAVVNLFLTGRGINVLQDDVFDGPVLVGGWGDLILILVTLVATIGVYVQVRRD